MAQTRERWATRLGIVFAVAGSAVGLGNFLRFPGQVVQNGGGTFLIPYFISFLLLGLPLCWIEWTMGRKGGSLSHGSLPGILDAITGKRWAKYLGVLGLFVPLVIFFYYTYIVSWCLAYSFFSLTGAYADVAEPGQMRNFLSAFQGVERNEFFSHLGIAYIFFLITFAVNMVVIYKGLTRGIEFLCKIAVPFLIVGGILLVVRIFTLGTPQPELTDRTVINGLGFMWNPDFTHLARPEVWLAAAGQIFFTLSVGLGAILTYASYLKENDDITLSSTTAASMNELFEVVIGGSIVIPAAFVFLGAEATRLTAERGTFDLGFVTMPIIFNRIPFGEIVGFYWFFLLFLAGITSTISLMQPIISFLEDEFEWNRHTSAIALGIVCFVVTHICIFGLAAGVLNEFDFWGGQLFITLCAFVVVCVFVRFVGIKNGWKEMHRGSDLVLPSWLRYLLYITPFYLGAIILYWALFNWIPWIAQPFGYEITLSLSRAFPFVQISSVPCEPNTVIIWTRVGLLGLMGSLLVLIAYAWHRKKAHHPSLPSLP